MRATHLFHNTSEVKANEWFENWGGRMTQRGNMKLGPKQPRAGKKPEMGLKLSSSISESFWVVFVDRQIGTLDNNGDEKSLVSVAAAAWSANYGLKGLRHWWEPILLEQCFGLSGSDADNELASFLVFVPFGFATMGRHEHWSKDRCSMNNYGQLKHLKISILSI